MAEEILFNNDKVRVSSSAVTVKKSGETYFLNQVTGVKLTRERSVLVAVGVALFLAGLGIGFLAYKAAANGAEVGGGGLLGGPLLIILGSVLFTAKPTFTLTFSMSNSRRPAKVIVTQDAAFATEAHEAILKAMAER